MDYSANFIDPNCRDWAVMSLLATQVPLPDASELISEDFSWVNTHYSPTNSSISETGCDRHSTANLAKENRNGQPKPLDKFYKEVTISTPNSSSYSKKGKSVGLQEDYNRGRGPPSDASKEKNRIAARKCRQKSRNGVEALQQHEQQLVEIRGMLEQTVEELRVEILGLKHEILRHGYCDCNYIQSYITKAAYDLAPQSC